LSASAATYGGRAPACKLVSGVTASLSLIASKTRTQLLALGVSVGLTERCIKELPLQSFTLAQTQTYRGYAVLGERKSFDGIFDRRYRVCLRKKSKALKAESHESDSSKDGVASKETAKELPGWSRGAE
jgi:hypothetical protein